MQKSEHKWRHEEETKMLKKKKVEKSKACYNVEHSAIGNKVVIAFTIIFRV
jgi:hypothetical protein